MNGRSTGKLDKTAIEYPARWRISAPGLGQPLSIENNSWSPAVAAAAAGMHDVTFDYPGYGKARHVRLAQEADVQAVKRPPTGETKKPPPGGPNDGQETTNQAGTNPAKPIRKRPARRGLESDEKATARPRPVKPVHNGFHNPYNFISAPPPNRGHRELGHHAPAGHDRYHPDKWSGRIHIRIETKTPLLLPDAAKATTDSHKHKTFPLRRGADGNPYLAPTSLRGALRAAYEAVTNSRFGVFEKHGTPLARRMEAGEGLAMVPARVRNASTLELFFGPGAPPAPPNPNLGVTKGRAPTIEG